jgi:hypothetical protein
VLTKVYHHNAVKLLSQNREKLQNAGEKGKMG